MQSIVIHLHQFHLIIPSLRETDRLCYRKQIDSIHIDAKSLQPCLQRRRARNDAHAQGLFIVNLTPPVHPLIVLCGQHFGVGSIPWSPLAGGILSRPLGTKTQRSETDR